ncbi:MAG: hypothetical protein GXP45_04960 [bacterium]|nr:hypothetical protein [bacterium]
MEEKQKAFLKKYNIESFDDLEEQANNRVSNTKMYYYLKETSWFKRYPKLSDISLPE